MDEIVFGRVDPEDHKRMEAIFRLRVLAWNESPFRPRMSAESWSDADDAAARHWAATVRGELIGAARLSLHETANELPEAVMFNGLPLVGPLASMNRLVVHPRARQRGLPNQFDSVRLVAARESGARTVVAHSWNPRRVQQLRARGFVVVRESPCPLVVGEDGREALESVLVLDTRTEAVDTRG